MITELFPLFADLLRRRILFAQWRLKSKKDVVRIHIQTHRKAGHPSWTWTVSFQSQQQSEVIHYFEKRCWTEYESIHFMIWSPIFSANFSLQLANTNNFFYLYLLKCTKTDEPHQNQIRIFINLSASLFPPSRPNRNILTLTYITLYK